MKKAWKRQMSNRVACPSALVGLRSGMRRTTNRPGICSLVLRELNAVKSISATSPREIHRWVGFVEDRVGVLDRDPGIFADLCDSCFDLWGPNAR